jgi:hypothetical protein
MTSVLKVDTIQNSSGTGTLTVPETTGTIATTNGTTHAAYYQISQNVTADTDPITDWSLITNLGTAPTLSSGIFTFPVSGFYIITTSVFLRTVSSGTTTFNTFISTDSGSSYTKKTYALNELFNTGGQADMTVGSQLLLDVTDASTHRMKFTLDISSSSSLVAGNMSSTMMIQRIGDT